MAEASGDPVKIAAIKKTIEQEYRLCTSHTAARLKRVELTVNEIKAGLIPANMFSELKEGLSNLTTTVEGLKGEVEGWKQKARGAKMLWNLLGYIAAAGGSGYIVKMLLGSAKAAAAGGVVP
ncbi:MAG: hypothetical protein J6Q22_10750 [Prevotella sp.]|nr:hypothetical protein [Prevotella sp.]